jgi:ATP-dependent DNA helicase RecQ
LSSVITTSAEQILNNVFGFSAFRPGQQEIVDLLSAGCNTLAVMPTGAGKSLCYQIPALLHERLAVVVSPLVALMDDQVAALRANGVNAACVHSGLPRDEQVANWRSVAAGECHLLYLSPERLMTERMLAAIERIDPAYLIVDEAHCISKWGASFRPEYEQLSGLCERFPKATIAAFTATADLATREDIAQKLFRGEGRTIVHGFDRPNLSLAVAVKSSWKNQLLDFLHDKRDSAGIVYCLSRKSTEEVAAYLNQSGFRAIAYHAGQDAELRRSNQNIFMSENAVTMVATIAFGMGIDKPDIRYVCHLNLPGSMEAYYQEIGRAGRDGAPADTVLFYDLQDIRQRRMFIEQDDAEPEHRLREHKRLDALLAYCEAPGCRRTALLAYFDEAMEACGNCDNCLDPPQLIDGTSDAKILLAVIQATGESFGGAHVIDVVSGANTAKISARGHDKLPSFGLGAKQGKGHWQGFVRQAIAGQYLSINIQRYGALEMTGLGRAVLDGSTAFKLRVQAAHPAKQTGRNASPAVQRAAAPLTRADTQLLAALKQLRLELARSRRAPAYVVFTDATLMEIAHKRPRTLEQLGTINGVGPKKLNDFGAVMIEAVTAFAAA